LTHSPYTAAPDGLKLNLLEGLSPQDRKRYPLYDGVVGYFRDALYRVAHVSWAGNEQHNPGQPLHWARGKSTDQLNCIARHLAEVDTTALTDATEIALASTAWRALAALQIFLEQRHGLVPPINARSND
jgi:hypothetical protein